MKRNVLLIILILWMVTVFIFSNQEGGKSSETSLGFIKQIIEILPGIKDMPDIEKQNLIESIHILVRKLAHFSIYAVGGIIAFLWLSTYNLSLGKTFILAISICLVYAISDEIHQLFVEGRSGEIRDVFIDTLGATTGTSIICALKKIYEKVFLKNIAKKNSI